MKLNVKAYGFAFAIVWAFCVVWSIIIAMIGRGTAPFDVANTLYLGYLTPSAGGLILGTIIALVDGFIAGIIFALVYNAFAKSGSK